jgi:ABC-type Fe3+/spermidine/putrescine transport system ATPase subunit
MRNRKITSMSPGYDSKSLHATLFSAQLIQQKCVLKTTALEKTKEKTNQKKERKREKRNL